MHKLSHLVGSDWVELGEYQWSFSPLCAEDEQ